MAGLKKFVTFESPQANHATKDSTSTIRIANKSRSSHTPLEYFLRKFHIVITNSPSSPPSVMAMLARYSKI
jgi:hypothetical protein